MSHTKEPWIIVPGGRLDPEVIITTQHRLDGRKAEICGMDVEFTGHHGDEQKANTRRIVACVNACAGIPTDTLETIPSWSSAGVKTLADVEKQRDKLLVALDMYERAFEGLFIHCLSNGVFNVRHQPLDCTALNNAHGAALAAIASVKASLSNAAKPVGPENETFTVGLFGVTKGGA